MSINVPFEFDLALAADLRQGKTQNIHSEGFAGEIGRRLGSDGYCLIRNVPTDDVTHIPTPLPEEHKTPLKLAPLALTWVMEKVLRAHIVGIYGVKSGESFHDIVPTAQEDGLSIINDAAWGRPLGFHQEMAFLNGPGKKNLPKYLILLCLRSGSDCLEERPTTYLLSIKEIVNHLSEQDLKNLSLPVYLVKAPEFFNFWIPKAQPIFYLSEEGKLSMTYSDLYTGIGDTVQVSEQACLELGVSIDEIYHSIFRLRGIYKNADSLKLIKIKFDRGDLVIIDNRYVQHARSPFKPKIQDRKLVRWLLRAYGADLEGPYAKKIFTEDVLSQRN